MGSSVLSLVVVAASISQAGYYPGTVRSQELEHQKQAFKRWWGDELELQLSKLPKQGSVPDYRVPYSGHDYPDSIGGTVRAMHKYDMAFHNGRGFATNYEQRDVSVHRSERETIQVRGLFGRIRTVRTAGPPNWYGHCNGWTAAAIRHAEPQRSVIRNGVEFTPADIKGMLAEIYMYCDSEFLGGLDRSINPATLHLALTNWVGRGAHPIGMEAAVGEVVINYPLYEYASDIYKHSADQVEVRTTIVYAVNTPREHDRSPTVNKKMYFHYALNLDDEGKITGGRYYGDSAQVDMLWTPLHPRQGGDRGNERGNPHLNVKEVLAIWRESVSEDIRSRWWNIDPTPEDRLEEQPRRTEVANAGPVANAAPEAAAAPTTEPASENAAAAAGGGSVADPSAAAPATDAPATDREPVEF